jgi:hypothetical protein
VLNGVSSRPYFENSGSLKYQVIDFIGEIIIALAYHVLVCMSINLFFMSDLAPEMAN